jgi:hypothetical protein
MRSEALEARLLLSAGLFSSDQDIGSPAQAGSAAYSNGSYTVVAGGTGVGGSSDQFHFAYEPFTGDGSIIARVTSLTNTSSAAQAGVMFRNSTAANAACAEVFLMPATEAEFVYRGSDGASAGSTAVFGPSIPRYIELTRSGSSVSAFYSSDGVAWTQLGSSQTINFGSGCLVGLAVASANTSLTTTATFTNVSVLPAGWSDNDIGSPPLPGSAGYGSSGNTFSLSGSGAGVGSSSDQLNFSNHSITGDATVTALLDSITNTNPAAKAGVMIRADTTAGAFFADLDVNPAGGVTFEWRNGSGAFSSSMVSVALPVWLRLADTGNNFAGSYSTDGVNFTQLGSTQSIAMPSATALAGVWASSHNASSLNTSVFTAASVNRGGWTDGDIGSPAIGGSAVYDTPGDTFTIAGNGSDIFGTADQFNFDSTPMNGDGNAIAYVDALTNTDPWAKAGVMIRNDTSAGSAFAAVVVSPSNGIAFEWRAAAGGTTNQEISSPPGGPTPAPVGLKLIRSGNTFTAYYCTDGINWIAVGPGQAATIATAALAGLAVTSHNPTALCTATFSSVGIGAAPPPDAGFYSASDQLFLNDLENREFLSFYNDTNATTGLVPDNVNANGGSPSSDSSIAAIGFGLSALTIADARGWLTHAAAYQRALNTVNFLYNNGANVNGFFYHFLNETTGARFGSSEVSSVDTAELMAGVLNAGQYWAGTALQTTATNLFNRVNWPWMLRSGGGHFYGAWTPETGFSGDYGDFSEAALLYMMSMGSPTFPTTQASWLSWSRTPVVHYSTYTFVTADDSALFTVQYPMAWFNLQGLTDSKGLNYFANAQTATLAQRQWMTDLSGTYSNWGPNMWGLTASEGPSGYTVWGGPPTSGPVDGTVVPTGSGGSLAFTPRLSLNVLENMKQTYGATVYQKYGLVDAFNPLKSWTSNLVLGIDVGMTLLAAENARSNFVWNVFGQNPSAQLALAQAFPSPSGKSVWVPNSGGDWNTTSNWANGKVPNAIGAEADLSGAINAAHSVNTDTAVTIGTIDFNNTHTYVIGGAGSLTLQASGGTSAQVIVELAGTQEINLPTTIASNTTFNVAPGATLVIADPLTINAGVAITQTGGGNVVYESTITFLGSGAQLALANTPMTTSAPIADVRGDLLANRIVSSGVGETLGYADIGGGQTQVRAAGMGDTNLDGVVNVADLANLAGNFGTTSGAAWIDGDFDYNGDVNVADLADLAANFGSGAVQPISQSPATPAAVAIATPASVAAPPAPVTPADVGTLDDRKHGDDLWHQLVEITNPGA